MPRAKAGASPWSHEGLERRGYKKCPYCWRHLVKIEDHIVAHKEGRIGPDGKRRDRTPAERARWAERHNGRPATAFHLRPRRTFVPTAVLQDILRLAPVDAKRFARDVDEAVDQDT